MTRTLLAFALLGLAACPAKPAVTGTTPTGTSAPVADTMADAPTHALGAKLEVKPPCNQSAYFKVAVPAGQAFKISASVSAGSAMIGVMDKNGGNVNTLEATVDKPVVVEANGQEETTFASVSETGACTGNTVTLAIE